MVVNSREALISFLKSICEVNFIGTQTIGYIMVEVVMAVVVGWTSVGRDWWMKVDRNEGRALRLGQYALLRKRKFCTVRMSEK